MYRPSHDLPRTTDAVPTRWSAASSRSWRGCPTACTVNRLHPVRPRSGTPGVSGDAAPVLAYAETMVSRADRASVSSSEPKTRPSASSSRVDRSRDTSSARKSTRSCRQTARRRCGRPAQPVSGRRHRRRLGAARASGDTPRPHAPGRPRPAPEPARYLQRRRADISSRR